ncbi:hypothetical protein EDC52_11013 [Biostraticola tofi]|uniref:Uncharacterized protein n=1 Tax=Biostraticola tofi TaxID=466109 RepID=A0A4R3YL91_9GAMM|nr:hypothetical protein EDC52_11013 [Biostraticola tofi]
MTSVVASRVKLLYVICMKTPITAGVDRIELMQTFIGIVEAGSLSAAAAAARLARPAFTDLPGLSSGTLLPGQA